MTPEPPSGDGADVAAWTAGRLLALHGEPGAAERLAAAIMDPPKGARYLLRGHLVTKEHRHDGPRMAACGKRARGTSAKPGTKPGTK